MNKIISLRFKKATMKLFGNNLTHTGTHTHTPKKHLAKRTNSDITSFEK